MRDAVYTLLVYKRTSKNLSEVAMEFIKVLKVLFRPWLDLFKKIDERSALIDECIDLELKRIRKELSDK